MILANKKKIFTLLIMCILSCFIYLKSNGNSFLLNESSIAKVPAATSKAVLAAKLAAVSPEAHVIQLVEAPAEAASGNRNAFFIDEDGNKIPLYNDETLFPKPDGGYCVMTKMNDKEEYFTALENTEHNCELLEKIMGYWVCMDGFHKKDNCVMLGFGICFDFRFEDAVVDKYGCQVYSFDPKMGIEDYDRKNGKNKFFNLGLSSFKGVRKITYEKRKNISAKVDRYVNIIKMLELENTEIDFLKLDIEGSELDFFLDTASNNPEMLVKVRQIQMEFHNLEQFPQWHSGTRIDTTQYDMMKIVDILHCHGFLLAHSKLHRWKSQLFMYNGKIRGACYITTWVRV